MEQLHKRFTTEQVKALLKGFCQGALDGLEVEEVLGIGKTRFFALLSEYRRNPEGFVLAYHRTNSSRIHASTEDGIERGLILQRELIENHDLPISSYNGFYCRGVQLNAPTF